MIFRVRSRGSHEVLGRLFPAGLVNGQAPLARHGVAQIRWRRLDAEAGVFELGQRALCPVSTETDVSAVLSAKRDGAVVVAVETAHQLDEGGRFKQPVLDFDPALAEHQIY